MRSRYRASARLRGAKEESERFCGRFQPLQEEVRHCPIITEADEITLQTRIDIVSVNGNLGNHYRMMWVKKAEMGNMGSPFLVLADGKIIGLLVLESGVKFGTDLILIVSDPAAPTSRYKRLSKLMLHLCCTETVLNMVNERTMWEHTGFTTRVLTNNPVSMKYRGYQMYLTPIFYRPPLVFFFCGSPNLLQI